MLYFILYSEDICNMDRCVDFALLNVTRQIAGGVVVPDCFFVIVSICMLLSVSGMVINMGNQCEHQE